MPLVADWWGHQKLYCPKIIKRNKRKVNKKLKNCSKKKKGRRKCLSGKEERKCIKNRKKTKKTEVICTQEERDKKYGKGWKWNTRNCGALNTPKDTKLCKKEKRKRCLKKELGSGSTPKEAREKCRAREGSAQKNRTEEKGQKTETAALKFPAARE